MFPGEKEIFRVMYAQVGEEEQVISPPYTRTPLDASMRGRVHMFHLSHFHRLVSFCWFGFGCWGGLVCFAVAFFLFTDQSVRSSCQPMTSLAYLHDCHSRYDERSIVQKKIIF